MSEHLTQLEIFYEIAMSIGRSLDLEKMLKQALTVILRKLNCSAGGVFLHETDRGLQPKLKTFLLPRTFAANEDYQEISDIINQLIAERRANGNVDIFPPQHIARESGNTLIMEMPNAGFIFLKNNSQPFKKNLIMSLSDPVEKLAAACIACYQSDALILSQYDLELRVSERTNQLEKSNMELQNAYDKLQKAQKQLVHNEKMVSIGQLAAGVAHEINNPTGFISSNLSTMTEYFTALHLFYNLTMALIDNLSNEDNKSVESTLQKINNLIEEEDLPFILADGTQLLSESIDGAVRIQEIVLGLRNFARVDSSEPAVADINTVINDALRLTWSELKYNCEVEKNLGNLPRILCRSDQLVQVFVNILVNATQAIKTHGQIRIESYLEDNFINVKICDNGTGISEEHIPKLFDPFFTTKDIGKGTGLGLSISHGIIEKHGGFIEVESTIGVGTCFKIKLPVNEKPHS